MKRLSVGCRQGRDKFNRILLCISLSFWLIKITWSPANIVIARGCVHRTASSNSLLKNVSVIYSLRFVIAENPS